MKPTMVIAVVLTLSVYFTPRCKGQSSPDTNKQNSARQKNPDATLPVPYQINNQWISTEAQSANDQSPQWYKSPEWILVIVGCITFLVIGWQSWETRRAATATREAAEATRRSVDVLVRSERAWVVVSVPDSQYLSPLRPGMIPPYNTFRFDIVNKGKTVARLMELDGDYRVIENDFTLPNVPIYPDKPTGSLNVAHAGVLVPGSDMEGLYIEIAEGFDPGKATRIRNGDIRVYAYCRLRYFDFSDEERILQFCYRYSIGRKGPTDHGWSLAGPLDGCPPTYNSHT